MKKVDPIHLLFLSTKRMEVEVGSDELSGRSVDDRQCRSVENFSFLDTAVTVFNEEGRPVHQLVLNTKRMESQGK